MSEASDVRSHGETRAAADEPADAFDAAVEALRAGRPVLVHDAADREGETDLIYPAGAVTPDAVAHMRNDAGGLICVALSDAVAETFSLPFLADELDHPAAAGHELGYDERASFSLTVNHRDTYTGVTDRDRSRTIRALASAADRPADTDFAAEFRSPGHVHLLRAAPDLLAQREGHTELGVALAAAADLPPAVVVCEMLDDDTGEALAPADARDYARSRDLVYLEGSTIVDRVA